jgi:hypothetical protein
MKLKKGDRVIITNYHGINYSIKIGDRGTICDAPEGICFDKIIQEGHTCSGNCGKGHGWYVPPRFFKKLERQLEFDF